MDVELVFPTTSPVRHGTAPHRMLVVRDTICDNVFCLQFHVMI